MMNQKTAVYEATMATLAEKQIDFTDGENLSQVMTKDLRKDVVSIVTAAFVAGEVELSAEAKAKYSDEAKVKAYASGLVNNWHRKDTRFNGGEKYVAKNPGSRAGSGDSVLKNLKALRSTRTDEAELTAIDEAIAKRTIEVAADKAKKITVDMDKIPAELRELLGV